MIIIKRIMVVCDERPLLDLIRQALEKGGYVVTTHIDADTAWAGLKAGPRDYDMLFTDYQLGGSMTGIELCRATKLLRPELPVVVMSGYPVAEIGAEVNEAGADDFLQKPFKMGELYVAIAEAGDC